MKKQSCRQPIALLSLGYDPITGTQNVADVQPAHCLRSIGRALAKLGWQVDLFVSRSTAAEAAVTVHSPYFRIIRLTALEPNASPQTAIEALPGFIESFHAFQTKEGTNYPLLYTADWLSGWAGLQIKAERGVQLVHFDSPIAPVTDYSQTAQTLTSVQMATRQQLWQQADRVVIPPVLTDVQPISGCHTDLTVLKSASADRPSKAEAKSRLGVAPTDQVALYVGQFAPHSGLETLIGAFAQCLDPQQYHRSHGLKLLLVNTEAAYPQFAEQIDQLALSDLIQIHNLSSTADRALYYAAADVCVIPSVYEPFGQRAIEAMTYGVPVIASNIGGLKFTVIPEETGLLVQAHDGDAFAEAIDRILSDELWAMKLRKQATDDRAVPIAAQLSDVFRQTLAQTLTNDALWRSPAQLPQSAETVSNSSDPLVKVS